MKQPMSNTLSPFDAKIHRMGRLSTVIVWVFFLLVPAAVCTVFHLKVDLALTFKAAAPIMLIFAITGVCEKLSMSPIIGPGAVYLASSTGNIQNMKLPAALNAMNIMECEGQSRVHHRGGRLLLCHHPHRVLRDAVPGPLDDPAAHKSGGRPRL